MVEPVISTGAALVGAGAWFANRLLGPSADSLGEQLEAFFTNRLSKIFKRAEEINQGQEPKPLPPAFAFLAISKAGLSEDDDELTEMWAELLLSASRNYRPAHTNFVDILSQLGTREVDILNQLVEKGKSYSQWPAVNQKSGMRGQLRNRFKAVYYRDEKEPGEMIEEARLRSQEVYGVELGWPGRITAVDYPYHCEKTKTYGTVSGGINRTASYDILARQQLIEFFAFDLNQSFSSPYVEGFLLTSLGLEFVQTCRGER